MLTAECVVECGRSGDTGAFHVHRFEQRSHSMRRAFSIFMAALLWSATPFGQAGAQAPAGPAGQAGRGGGRGPQGPQVVSPEVNADRTVTLRVLAPKATEITVTGEIL